MIRVFTRAACLEHRTPPGYPEKPERLLINIKYHIHATNADRNLVFPFYVSPDEE